MYNLCVLKSAMRFLLMMLLLFCMQASMASSAPGFTLPTSNGEISLAQLKGKVVYLDFWASWCIPCRQSFPWLNEMSARYKKQGFVVLAINLDKDKKLMQRFLKQYPAKFIVAHDSAGNSARDYKVKGMPSSYLISRDGEIVSSHIGFRQKDKLALEDKIRSLVNH